MSCPDLALAGEAQHAVHGRSLTMMSAKGIAVRTEQLRQSLDWSHQVSQEACRVLDQYCSQLSDIERIVQPVVLKTQQLIQTRENIKRARAQAEEVLDHLDASRKVLPPSARNLDMLCCASYTADLLSGRVQDLARASR